VKIAIAVQGRFHAFDLAKALVNRSHDVTVFTNYPKWAVKRFGFPPERVRSFWFHGIVSRIAHRLHDAGLWAEPERWLHPMFGRWISAELSKDRWDVVHGWSGVSEEYLATHPQEETVKLMMRGSAHIQVQSRILEEEETRTGHPLDRPGPWIIAREQREYQLADRIVLLSTFALRSFVKEGWERGKLRLLSLGTNAEAFRPDSEVIQERCRRILSGEPLRIIYVGNVSYQKGMWDLAEIIKSLSRGRFRFQLVGSVLRETSDTVATLENFAEFIPRRPQKNLPQFYVNNDLFVFPTLYEGFGMAYAEAIAHGLPVIGTTGGAIPDTVPASAGVLVPPGDAPALAAALRHLIEDSGARERLAAGARAAADKLPTWRGSAEKFSQAIERVI
jgi:glycosyltransferase involved in cell wall biosynthesis